MIPAVPVPRSAGILRPVELKLKPGWRYDPKRKVFTREDGQEFSPGRTVPKGSRIAAKVPALLRRAPARLSKAERDLQRYVQVILPRTVSAADHVEAVRRWPCVEAAHVAPEVSLPRAPRSRS